MKLPVRNIETLLKRAEIVRKANEQLELKQASDAIATGKVATSTLAAKGRLRQMWACCSIRQHS